MANGSCLCGTVKFSVDDDGSDMTHCHCSMCRRLHGALFATFYHATGLTYTQGERSIERYESSPGFPRSFCSCCGSPLPDAVPGSDGVYVPAGLMDDDPGARPQAHIFTESKADAYTITDGLPQRTHYGDGDASRAVETADAPVRIDAVSGHCQCGDVSFEYTGEPAMVMHCHCSRCRKVKGAAHATNVFVGADQFTWTGGEDHVTDYAHADARFFGHAFCRTCGSSVPRARPDGSAYNIPAGSLDQAPGIEAKGHIFVGSKAPWFEVTEDKPRWDEMPE